MRYGQKGAYFNRFRAIRRQNLPKQHAHVKFWNKKILKEIQKGALHVDTRRNKCLK